MKRRRKAKVPRKRKGPQGRRGITPAERTAICKAVCDLYATDQHPIDECCQANGISASMFDNWVNDFPEIGSLYKAAKDKSTGVFKARLRVKAKRALEKLVDGFTYEEVTKEGVATPDPVTGQPRVTVTNVKTVTKQVAPNPTSVIFSLKNVDAENFKDRVQQEISGPDGAPVEIETKSKDPFDHEKFVQLFSGISHGLSKADGAGQSVHSVDPIPEAGGLPGASGS